MSGESAPPLPAELRSDVIDWAGAFAAPGAAPRVWRAALQQDLGAELRGAVVAEVRRENRRALFGGVVAVMLASALVIALVLGARQLLILPPLVTALVTAAGVLGITVVGSRWFRRIHARERYAARVLDVHQAFVEQACTAASPVLDGRR